MNDPGKEKNVRYGRVSAAGLLLLVACGGTSSTVIERPGPTVTATVPRPAVTKTVTRPVPGPAGPAGITCYEYNGGNGNGVSLAPVSTANNVTALCSVSVVKLTPYAAGQYTLTISAPDGAKQTYLVGPDTAVSGDPVPGSGTGAACTTIAGMFPGGEPGHRDSTGFCVPDH